MIGKTITHYKILEEIGEGGMGMVYKAEDLKLKRLVALKFISPVLTRHKEANERFIYEAQAASALDHQNIATIYEIDESDDGRMFIAMAYYSGETLQEKISKAQIGISEAVDISIQIAEGLSKAHKKGIIHKDIKPANLLIDEEGNVKIIDFGLAELLTTNNISNTGSTKGTVAYMAPEQITGRTVDYRADIWSLGVVLYEMVTCIRPFQGKYDQEIIFSIMNETPEPITNLRPDADDNLEKFLMKALAKNPDKRFADMGKMLTALKNQAVKIQSQRFSDQEIQLQGKQIKSLAVLPLVNLSQDPEQEYFTDGMTDALITDLAKIGTLKIISRTSIMMYKSTDKSLPEIAEELKVDVVVEGSVLRIGNRVQLNVQLIHASADAHLWAETYDRELQDVLILQSELTRAIAKEIKITLTNEEEKRLAWNRPVNPEPYDNYLKGSFHFYKLSPGQFDIALEYYQIALNKDSGYALAHAGIADVWFARSYWGITPPKESFPKAKAAVLKALELDDTLEEAHDVLARINFFYDWDWDAAEIEFRNSIQLNPNYADAHLFYSAFLRSMNRDEEAASEVERGLELDPINFFSQGFCVGHLLHQRKYDEAIVKLREILKREPNFPMAHRYLWISYHQKQLYDKAIEEAKNYFAAVGKHEISDLLALDYDKAGYQGVMNLVAERLKDSAEQNYIQPAMIARLYAYAGNNNSALEWLNKAYEERDPLLTNLGVSQDWDGIRDEPQFRNLLKQMNLQVRSKIV